MKLRQTGDLCRKKNLELMIIKNKKKNIFLYISILTIALAYFAFFLSMDGRNLKRVLRGPYYNFYDYFLTLDLGFSSIPAIDSNQSYRWKKNEDTSYFGRLILSYAGSLGKKIPEIFSKKIQNFSARPPLEVIYIDIRFEGYRQLLADRERAMRLDILHKPKKIKAEIRFKGKIYNAKVRLK